MTQKPTKTAKKVVPSRRVKKALPPCISIMSEQVVFFGEGRKTFPGQPSYEMVRRWCRLGCRGKENSFYHRLESCKIDGYHATSIEAHARWTRRVNGDPPPLEQDASVED